MNWHFPKYFFFLFLFFGAKSGRPRLYMERTRVKDMREKDSQNRPGYTRRMLAHFMARAFKQPTMNNQNYTDEKTL